MASGTVSSSYTRCAAQNGINNWSIAFVWFMLILGITSTYILAPLDQLRLGSDLVANVIDRNNRWYAALAVAISTAFIISMKLTADYNDVEEEEERPRTW